MKNLELGLKAATGAACAYEAFAIATGLVPTISKEVGVHLWLGGPILAGLALHFYWPQAVAVFKRLTGR